MSFFHNCSLSYIDNYTSLEACSSRRNIVRLVEFLPVYKEDNLCDFPFQRPDKAGYQVCIFSYFSTKT